MGRAQPNGTYASGMRLALGARSRRFEPGRPNHLLNLRGRLGRPTISHPMSTTGG